jgi:DNA-binding transcriptional LysR family regulator
LQTALGHHVVFDPRTSDRRFTIHSTDIAMITFLPSLMKAMGAIAPGLRVELLRITEDTPKQLESGESDLAIGFMLPLGAGYCQQRLFRERLVCVVREGHPRIGDTFGVDEFQRETHLAIATSGTGHAILEKTLTAKRLTRKIGLTVPSFLGVGPLLSSLDYVATVPERLARHLAPEVPIKIFPLPVPVAPYVIVQQWHERYTHDPGSRWLRALIAKLFTSNKPLPGSLKSSPRQGTKAATTPINGIDKIHQRTIIDLRQRPS